MSLIELKKALKEKDLVMGSRKIIGKLKNDKIKKVFISDNCREDVVRDVEYYSKIYKVEIYRIKKSNQELGTMCKKPFAISVLGY